MAVNAKQRSLAPAKSAEQTQLERFLSNWDARLRLTQSVIWLPRGLAGGLVAALLLSAAARFWPIMPTTTLLIMAGVLGLIGVVGVLLGVWLWQRSPLQMARRFDRVFGLKERMSTAVELTQGSLPIESEEIAERQINQALDYASTVQAARGIPFRADWREWAAPLVALILVAVALWYPNPQDEILADQADVQNAIDREIENLEELREEALTDETLTPEEQAAIVEALDEAIETLEQDGITQQEAVAALDAAEEALRDLSDEAAARQQQAMEEASGLLDGTAAQEAAEALAEGNAAAAAEALDNLDLDSMTPEEQAELAEALEAAADALEGTNPEAAEAMREAADAIQSGDTAAAEEALGEAADAMQEGQSAEQVESYADEVRKGEGEVAGAGQQGENGQQGQGSQPGQNGMGQAPQAQQGQGQGQSQQQGGQSGAGRGEGDGVPDSPGSGQQSTDNGPGDGGETAPEIYDPQRIGGEGGPEVDVPGDPGAGMPTGAEGEFVENPNGDSSVPYDEVYGDYEESVNEAMDSGYVPLGLRGLIQQYFSRLDPARAR